MAEKTDQIEGIIEELTPEEQKVIAKALKRVETEIFHNVVRRISIWIGIVLSIFLIGGLVNMNACSTNIESSTAQKMANDPELREKVVNKAQENLKEIQEKLKSLNARAEEIEKENAQMVAISERDLVQIRFMLERISRELSNLPSQKRNEANTSGNKNQ